MTLERGEKLEVMEEKAEDLENQSKRFQQRATQVKRHFFCQYIKLTILIVFILAVIATIIGVVIWQKTKSSSSSDSSSTPTTPPNFQSPPGNSALAPATPVLQSIAQGTSPGTLSVTVQEGPGGAGIFWYWAFQISTPSSSQVQYPCTISPCSLTGLTSNTNYTVLARAYSTYGVASTDSNTLPAYPN